MQMTHILSIVSFLQACECIPEARETMQINVGISDEDVSLLGAYSNFKDRRYKYWCRRKVVPISRKRPVEAPYIHLGRKYLSGSDERETGAAGAAV